MEDFLDEIDNLMTILTGVKLHKARRIKIPNPRPYDNEIVLGLPSSLIAKMYGSTTKNIEKRKSQLKKQGIKVLDARSRVARLARLLTKDQLDRVYEIMVKMIMEEYEKKGREKGYNMEEVQYNRSNTPSKRYDKYRV